MNKGIFSSWFREFATLVFTQTVQAFLLAIVMSIIVSCLSEANGNGINAAGLLAIIALSSFGKIEMLVKNIFGVTSGFGDPSLKNGRGITAGTMLAWRGGKRLLDNGDKMIKGHRMKTEARKGMEALATSGGGELDANKNYIDGDEKSKLGSDVGKQIDEQVVKLQTLGDIQELTKAINNLRTATDNANKNTTQDKLKEYQEMYQKGKDLQKSSVLESAGALVGGTAGTIVGLANGEDVAKTALAGAGGGDALGQYVSDHTSASRDHKRKINELDSKIVENINSSNEKVQKFKEEAAKNVASGKVKDVAAYNRYVVDATKKYRNDFNENRQNIMNKASEKGVSKRSLQKMQKDLDNKIDAGNS